MERVRYHRRKNGKTWIKEDNANNEQHKQEEKIKKWKFDSRKLILKANFCNKMVNKEHNHGKTSKENINHYLNCLQQ